MSRIVSALLAALTLLLSTSPAHADWRDRLEAFWARCEVDWHRNNCWPEPFVRPDRAHVTTFNASVEAAGWHRQNLLGAHHFTPDSTALSTSGQLKVRGILTQAPHQYRTVFVERSVNRDLTAARMDAVEQYASNWLPDGLVADVQESHQFVEGSPAPMVDYINVRFRETLPVPQLPTPTGNEF